jgi:hypothetical protein
VSDEVVDVGRIVPSTRDLFGALATRRKTLSLIPRIEHDEVASEVARVAAVDVRAYAMPAADAQLQIAATSTKSTPALCLQPATTLEDCQRARFFGADGVVIAASDAASWEALSKAAQSMHMVALARATDLASAEQSVAWGARAVLIDGQTDLAAIAASLPKTILVAHASSVEALRSYVGVVDAAVLSEAIHASADFEALLDELDG